MINVGDRITITMCERDDLDLAEWLQDTSEDDEFIVTEVDEDACLCWISNCDYGISLANVELFNGTNFTIIG